MVNGLIERKLPSFAMAGKSDVELGFLMGSSQDNSNIKRLVRRIALNFQSILLGDKPSELPIFFTEKKQLTINMETAHKIGFSPSYKMLEKAKLINLDFKRVDSLSMFDSVERALGSNLNLAVKDKEVKTGWQDVKKAWSTLLPKISLSNTYSTIDEDRAEASMGSMPERTASASAILNQTIFSEDRFANISVQKNLQRSLESERKELELDIIEATVVSYLNVLRTMRMEQIHLHNLDLSRSNMESAKVRKKIGQSSSSDIYRWESEIANNQKSILSAQANHENAKITLNRIIHEPLEKDFDFEDIGMKNEEIFLDQDVLNIVDNPYIFQSLRDFMVLQGIEVAPEIDQMEYLIKAKERVLKSNQRSFLLPEVSFQATLTENYYKDGVGVPERSTKNDHDFTALVKITYPLFEGGDKFFSINRAKMELDQFETQLDSLKEKISEEIRTTLQSAGSSYGSIKWSKRAEDAASKNLKLVQDSYSQGAVNITVLLDAQNNYLNANQVATNSVYDFLIDYFEYQRAIRKFYFRISGQEKASIMTKLKLFLKANDIDL